MVRIERLSKTFGKKVVFYDVSLKLENKNYALLGPNGSGKTTLFRVLVGLLPQDTGIIRIDNVDGLFGNKVKIGYLPQSFGTFSYLTVEEQLQYYASLKYRKDDGIAWNHEIERVMRLTDLEEHRSNKCSVLSGGMVRRLGIAQALMGKPDLILLDEPSVGLDVGERFHLKTILYNIKGIQPLIMSTHILEDVQDVCEDIIVLFHEKVLFQGKVEQLEQPTLETGYLYLLNTLGTNIAKEEHD